MRLILIILVSCLSLQVLAQSDLEKQLKDCENRLSNLSDSQLVIKERLEVIKLKWIQEQIKTVALPSWNGQGIIVHHTAMSLFYDEQHEQPRWVIHIVMPDIKTGVETRTNDFRPDSLVTTGSAVKEDYWSTGYDRGHLAPSADFRWCRKALSESYYYSNMSPQKPEFNRGKWAQLEDMGRQYVISSGEPLFVITGPLLNDTLKSIGKVNKVSIPKYYYKIFYDNEGPEKKGIAFLMLNGTNTKPVISYTVSIDSVESITGIDFFPLLPDSLETRIEKMNNYDVWLSEKESGNVKPLEVEEMPKDAVSTADASNFIGQKKQVCGTVVATRILKDNKGIILNLDQKFPNQVFSATIWQSNVANFSYEPATALMNRKVCLTGTIEKYKEKPTMEIRNEKAVEFLDNE